LLLNAGSYVSESDFFEKNWQQSFWGSNYKRLAAVKKKYDPEGLFLYIMVWVAKNGVMTDSQGFANLMQQRDLQNGA
jgi:hypothetical protein